MRSMLHQAIHTLFLANRALVKAQLSDARLTDCQMKAGSVDHGGLSFIAYFAFGVFGCAGHDRRVRICAVTVYNIIWDNWIWIFCVLRQWVRITIGYGSRIDVFPNYLTVKFAFFIETFLRVGCLFRQHIITFITYLAYSVFELITAFFTLQHTILTIQLRWQT